MGREHERHHPGLSRWSDVWPLRASHPKRLIPRHGSARPSGPGGAVARDEGQASAACRCQTSLHRRGVGGGVQLAKHIYGKKIA